jgi:hypothetical protein
MGHTIKTGGVLPLSVTRSLRRIGTQVPRTLHTVLA